MSKNYATEGHKMSESLTLSQPNLNTLIAGLQTLKHREPAFRNEEEARARVANSPLFKALAR